MKLSFSFVLCSVLVFATNYCSDVYAEDISEEKREPQSDYETCAVDYFKKKGKLPQNYEWFEASPLCNEVMINTLRDFKEIVSGKIKEEQPTESNCIMEQFEKNGTIEVLLKIVVIIDNRTGGIHADVLKSARDEAKDQLKATATACGLGDESKLISYFDRVLEKTPGSVT